MTTTPTSSLSSANGSQFQFSGIVSGLDTTSIISQLMAVESQPQTNLKNAVAAQQNQVSTLQSINAALVALSSQADTFNSGSTWTQLTATSSSSAVTVAATSAAPQGSLSMTVGTLASAAQLGFTTPHALTDVVATPGSSLDVTLTDGTTASVATGDGTLSSVISALNGLKDPSGKPQLVASAVNVGGGQVQLLVSAASTGAGSLSISDAGGASFFSAVTASAGSNASLTLGAGITATSTTNTFTDLLPGVTVTLGGGTPTGQPIALNITDDGSSRANGVNQFVSSINSLFTTIQSTTAYGVVGSDGTVSGGGALPGDLDLSSVVGNLVNTIFPPGNTTMATLGLDVDKTGALTFDQSKFEAAYQADPAGTQQSIMDWVKRVQTVSDNASLPSSGTLSQSIQGMNDQIAQENSSIADWDTRLQLKQQQLETMYTNLETQLSTLQSQQSWLSSQLGSLDSGWAQNSGS
ncbi:MAG: flagellar filament capping protein FliD [Nocardioidaceae bacterium]|nr:flagellar filament capping protein FliD [Nocardioidaceae bacterium]MCL2613282.1 flagellar filament capping protein FliD [Nocardioidaceae bacterium]